jgi:hypothetical protein
MPRPLPTRLLAATLGVVAGLCVPSPAVAGDMSHGSGARLLSHRGAAQLSLGPALLAPAAAIEIPPELAGVAAAIAGAEDVASAAEAAARREDQRSASELARRLVAGQVMLAQKDSERAAVVFLDLLENAAGTPAASQAPLLPRRGAAPARHAPLGHRVFLRHPRRPRRRRPPPASIRGRPFARPRQPVAPRGPRPQARARRPARAARPPAGSRPDRRPAADAGPGPARRARPDRRPAPARLGRRDRPR